MSEHVADIILNDADPHILLHKGFASIVKTHQVTWPHQDASSDSQ